jgi:ABC-type dipeptide/oligopeptide/nickel transport system ATPase component
MKITIPELSLVALVGPSGSGKSTFARKHFGGFEVLSSDNCRGLVSNDANDQGVTKDAFLVLNYIASKRLDRGHLTVVDATNVQPEARRSSRVYLVRTASDPLVLAAAFRNELRQLDASVPMSDVLTLRGFVEDNLRARKMPAIVISAFAVLALVLTSVGVMRCSRT